jgi:hypothetical protein
MLYSLCPRSFDAWERLPSRTSRSAFAYAHVKADWIDLCHPCWSGKKLRVLERVQPGDTEYIPAHAVCTVTATTSSAAALNVKGHIRSPFPEVAEHASEGKNVALDRRPIPSCCVPIGLPPARISQLCYDIIR